MTKIELSRVIVSREEWYNLPTIKQLELTALSRMTGEEISEQLTRAERRLYESLLEE